MGFLIGGLISVFIISRLALFALTKMKRRLPRIFLAHAATALIVILLAGHLIPIDHKFAPMLAVQAYWLPWAVWLGVDCFRSLSAQRDSDDAARKAAKRAAVGDAD